LPSAAGLRPSRGALEKWFDVHLTVRIVAAILVLPGECCGGNRT
jgi:hypothetical protein